MTGILITIVKTEVLPKIKSFYMFLVVVGLLFFHVTFTTVYIAWELHLI